LRIAKGMSIGLMTSGVDALDPIKNVLDAVQLCV